jgi:hypothetical protein
VILVPSSIQARDVGVEMSRTARTLLSMRAMNDLVREALIHGGEEWIATWLPRRFQRSYASLLGYVTSQRKSKAYRESTDGGMTYDEKKRKLQGHADPLVWTGNLRAQVFAQARATATATRGTARGRITFGRLAVGKPGSYVAPPPLVVSTLLGGPARRLPGQEVQTVRDGFLDYVRATLDGVTAKQARPLPAPATITDRRVQRYGERRWQESEARRAQSAIRGRIADRRARTAERHARWRQDAGGSSPIGVAAMTPAEARIRHRVQSRESYRRRASLINARRRLRRRGAI